MAESDVTASQLLLAEYERLKEEQKVRIGFRDNLIYATLASMAGVIAAALSAKGHANLLLLLPPVTTLLGWTYLVNDEKVSAIGRYIRDDLGSRLAATVNTGVFGWEIAHRSDPRRRTRKVLQLAVDLGGFCAPALTAIVIYWANGPLRWPFVVVSIIEAAAVCGLAVEIIRYADLGVGATAPRR
ncbi:hypothetical protein [Actinoplanes sp. GCM10030250]|uniref:hypothetical protein n=1 Tax=Actinoplanes sp. GCM10030250 TaxID=3273376 RepID=UPI00360A9831